jgi:hypothetical protein
MGFDVVGHGCWRYAAGFQANPAQWPDTQLMHSAALPASGAIPAMDVRCMRQRSSVPHNSSEQGGDRALKSVMASMGVFGHHLQVKSLTKQVQCAIYLPHQTGIRYQGHQESTTD